MRPITWTGRAFAGLLTILLLGGCEGPTRYPLRTDVAQETLKSALEAWQSGVKPEEMQDLSPPVTVQDFDWSGGAKLLAFEVQPDAKPVDANLLARVRLSLEGADGKTSEKTVTYLIGTDPVLTVFRDMFH